MKVNSTHRITVALRMAGIAGQDKLNGIFEHLSQGNRWQLSIFRTVHEFTDETVRREIERGTERAHHRDPLLAQSKGDFALGHRSREE